LELVLGDGHDLGGDAGRVREGEDGGFLADEQDGAGSLLGGVATGAAGGAVVLSWGVLSGEQPFGFCLADLGAYGVADIEQWGHGSSWLSVPVPQDNG
jgi:hypothetical protein